MDKQKLIQEMKECQELGEASKREIEDMGRLLILAESGLKERPLDRDFFRYVKEDHERRKHKHEMAYAIVQKMIEITTKE